MPSYVHTGQWANTFHIPERDEPVTLKPGETVKLRRKFVHDLLQPASRGTADSSAQSDPDQTDTAEGQE